MGQWDDGEMGRWGSSTDFCCNMLKKEAPRKNTWMMLEKSLVHVGDIRCLNVFALETT
jgi:hypothetical protein